MTTLPTFLSLFAHPDDETFQAAGTMARLRELGWHIVVCSATRGEEGEIAEGVAAERATLGAFREGELREAMRTIGVTDVRFLGYRDSGMDGSEANSNPEAFVQVPVEIAARAVADLIDKVKPSIVITFSPEGIYLHPDHIAIHKAVVKAMELIAEDKRRFRPDILLFASTPREWFLALSQIESNPFRDMSPEMLQKLGVPRAELTHRVAVDRYREQVRSALKAHASQFGTVDPLSWLPPEWMAEFLHYNYYQQASLPWNDRAPLPALFEPLI